jgi:hypothetical protein
MSSEEILNDFSRLTEAGANEAETRLKLINRVLFEVLGWTRDDVTVEEHVSEDGKSSYADYILRTAMTAIVIEAKKVPQEKVTVPNVRRIRLDRRMMTTEVGPVIAQARDYARKLAVPFAVATNADYWIIFSSTRVDGVRFEDSYGVIFSTITSALRDNFPEFHDLLSRASVISGSLENELLGRIENQIEERRLNKFYTRPFSRISRHSLFPLIEDAITTAFTEDIVNADPKLLQMCYVHTPERVRFDRRIEMHILKRHSVTTRAPMRPLREKHERGLTDLIKGAAGRVRPVAVLILGTVGSGKTTFLNFTRRVAAQTIFEPDLGKPYPHWIEADFRSFSKGQNVLEFMHAAIRNQINADPYLSDYERCIKHAYKDEIDALFRGPLYLLSQDESERKRRIAALLEDQYGKGAPYNEKVLTYAAQHSPVFLVIDNVDQFDDETVRADIFATAMAMSHRISGNLICSMREATYVLHRGTPVFDAFDFDPIVIDAPEVLAVLSKRFFVAKQLLSGQSGHFVAENGADVQVSDLSVIIDLVQSSVLGSEIGNLIAVLATSDIRLALRMTREFLQSGYTASGKALRIYQETGNYLLPPHEALRAIMVGTQAVYHEKLSVIGNPFDAWCGRTEAQLLRLYVLAALVQYSSGQGFQGLPGQEIKKVLCEIGFGDDVTLKVLSDLCTMRYIYTMAHSQASLEATYAPSRLGGYIVRDLVGNLMFIENVLIDTFIADTDMWEHLKELTDRIYSERDVLRKLRIRKERATVFFSYMKASYEQLRTDGLRRHVPVEWCSDPLASIENQFRSNLARAERSAERNYGQPDGRQGEP